jgi:serine/threonine protein kinase
MQGIYSNVTHDSKENEARQNQVGVNDKASSIKATKSKKDTNKSFEELSLIDKIKITIEKLKFFYHLKEDKEGSFYLNNVSTNQHQKLLQRGLSIFFSTAQKGETVGIRILEGENDDSTGRKCGGKTSFVIMGINGEVRFVLSKEKNLGEGTEGKVHLYSTRNTNKKCAVKSAKTYAQKLKENIAKKYEGDDEEDDRIEEFVERFSAHQKIKSQYEFKNKTPYEFNFFKFLRKEAEILKYLGKHIGLQHPFKPPTMLIMGIQRYTAKDAGINLMYRGVVYDGDAAVEGEGLLSIWTLEQVIKGLVQLGDGLEYCHEKGVYHVDIKPCNIFYLTKLFELRLGDFGGAWSKKDFLELNIKEIDKKQLFYHMNSTKGYFIPSEFEKIKQTDDLELAAYYRGCFDIFAFGATIYEILTHKFLFQEEFVEEESETIRLRIKNGLEMKFGQNPVFVAKVTDLITGMIHPGLEKRLTATQVKEKIQELLSLFGQKAGEETWK